MFDSFDGTSRAGRRADVSHELPLCTNPPRTSDFARNGRPSNRLRQSSKSIIPIKTGDATFAQLSPDEVSEVERAQLPSSRVRHGMRAPTCSTEPSSRAASGIATRAAERIQYCALLRDSWHYFEGARFTAPVTESRFGHGRSGLQRSHGSERGMQARSRLLTSRPSRCRGAKRMRTAVHRVGHRHRRGKERPSNG